MHEMITVLRSYQPTTNAFSTIVGSLAEHPVDSGLPTIAGRLLGAVSVNATEERHALQAVF